MRRDLKIFQKLKPSDKRSIDLTTILVSYHGLNKLPQIYRLHPPLIYCYLPALCPKSIELSWYVAQVPTRLVWTLTWRSWGRIHLQTHSGYWQSSGPRSGGWGWAPIFLLASSPGVLLSAWRPHPFLESETPSSAFQASNTQSSPSQDVNPSNLPSPSFFLLYLSNVSQRNASALMDSSDQTGPNQMAQDNPAMLLMLVSSQNSYVENHTSPPQVMVLGWGVIWRWLDDESRSFVNGISSLTKGPDGFCCPSVLWGYS